ncbi:MAG: imidazole glycerol phosphate synthase subunit HisH [Lentisphaeria bacterium]|nr:imidazole glycerol phosphate synthase subunit HisH [Lentisphaeria bacterium]
MNVVIIKYNAGNIFSVTSAFKRLGIEPIVSDDHAVIKNADCVIFPGVGEAESAMRYLKEKGLDTLIANLKQPFLGICLGMQLLCDHSEENNVDCLSVMPVAVKQFPPREKVPHMGWNTLTVRNNHPLFAKLPASAHFYFVHSYYVELSEFTIAENDYILPFTAAMQKDNFYAVQFHPEKSGKDGEQLLKNFLELASL